MARKPLIPAGSYLGDRPAPVDLMASVIARDRERSGRPAPVVEEEPAKEPAEAPPAKPFETPPAPSSPVEPPPAVAIELPAAAAPPASAPPEEDAKVSTPRTSRATSKPASRSAASGSAAPPPPDAAREAAWRRARRKGASLALPITLRAPEALNDFLDQLAHDLRRSKVKKQELVALAIQMLYVESETGADILALLGRRTEPDEDEDEEI